MLNTALKNDLKALKSNKANVDITTGNVSGNSIEIKVKGSPTFFESYTYYDKVEDMNSDLAELKKLIAA